MSKEEKIIKVLFDNQDSMSDGFKFYAGNDMKTTMYRIAKEILKAIEE